jgi:hypothetical protein
VKGGGIPSRYFGGLRERSKVPLPASGRRKAGRKRRRESVGGFKKMVPMPVGIKTDKTGGKKMKKLLVVLLSLGLIVAFSTAASAVDVKFGGSYYAVGLYEDNPALATDGYSHAMVYQRGRLNPVFVIAEGLTFSNRLDFLEKTWGSTLMYRPGSAGGADDQTASRRQNGYAMGGPGGSSTSATGNNPKVQENIEWERAWVTFMTAFGQFNVGYMNVDDWGTDYGDFSNTRHKIGFATQLGPVTLGVSYEKVYENDTASGVNVSANLTDADKDTYAIYGVYNARGVEAGLLYKYYVYNSLRPGMGGVTVTTGYPGMNQRLNLLSPYVKAAFGPFYVEGEAQYWFGKYAQYEQPQTGTLAALPQDVDLSAYGLYLKGQMNLGPAYFGALFAYTSGNDMSDDTKTTANPGGAGNNFSTVAMILMNQWFDIWNQGNSLAGNVPGGITSAKYNNVIYSTFAGINPTPKLNLEANLIYATVAEKALSKTAGVVRNADSDKLGWELDLKATYKIYDNLTYMVGAAYLWTGDYFQNFSKTGALMAAGTTREVDNDYMLMNQLTLMF